MNKFNKIVVALDKSKSAYHAVNYAIEFAKLINAKIEIISIIEYEVGNIDAGIWPSEIEKKNALYIKGLIGEIVKEHPKSTIEYFETKGIAEKEIIKAIKEWKADLLIIGHHTHSLLERLFVNSIEKKLINHLECPLLIIPEK